MFWQEEETELLQGTELQKLLKCDKALMREDWLDLAAPFIAQHCDRLPWETMSYSSFKACASLVSSRAFHIDKCDLSVLPPPSNSSLSLTPLALLAAPPRRNAFPYRSSLPRGLRAWPRHPPSLSACVREAAGCTAWAWCRSRTCSTIARTPSTCTWRETTTLTILTTRVTRRATTSARCTPTTSRAV